MKLICPIFLFLHSILFAHNPEWIMYTNGDKILDLLNDNNYLWLATDGGLVKLNKETDKIEFFNKANTNNGLMDNHIRVLAKDSVGNLWVGTEYGGISKFDGENWQNFIPSNSGLPWEYIHSLEIDQEDNVWIGSGESLVIFDGHNWKIYESGNPIMSYISINDILCLDNGDTWVGASWGLGKFESDSLLEEYGGINSEILSLILDEDENLWIGTSDSGLIKYDGQNYTTFDTTNSDIPGNVISDMKFDTQGNLWLTTENGLASYDGVSWRVFDKDNFHLLDDIFAIEIDNLDIIWLGSLKNGLIRFDRNSWKKYETSNSALFNNFLNLMATDEEGVVWITYYQPQDSVISFDRNEWRIHYQEDEEFWNSNFALFYDSDTMKVWKGRGILLEFVTNHNWVGVYNIKNYRHGNHLHVDKQGNLWQISVMGGLLKYDGNEWTLYNNKNTPINFTSVGLLALDDESNLFCFSDAGLIKYDGLNWSLYSYNVFLLDTLNHKPNALALDKLGNLWLGTGPRGSGSFYGEGLIKYDWNTITRYNTSNSDLPSNTIIDLNFDKYDNLWIGTTDAGLVKFDANNEWTIYNSENSGLYSRFDVGPIEIDVNDNIWLGTWWGGITVFNENGIIFTNVKEVNSNQIANTFYLYQNYPNPFNPSTKIKYIISSGRTNYYSERQNVTLTVYDILGREITTLVNEEKAPGAYEVKFDAEQFSSGIYFYKLTSGSFTQTKKFVLMK